ncbi:TerD family protein (plasmid) [Photobacterium sp. GJ3]|uniref:TerD family protein n=1 Tax=Photobacterium sp. GJ3 TaxID=2829502 RepID=UPI001B8C769C|nr:TerD family protein [Photobacterium sp. GJ3]QUJ69670.1 TerD family protein [Photobacterium sp. GJ3]
MAINLEKNSTISLTKSASVELKKLTLGLGWSPIRSTGFFGAIFGSGDIDLDASCVLLDDTGEVLDTVYFQQLKSKCKSVHHQGDNRTGEGDGDDEQIKINLEKLPNNVAYMALTVNSFRGQPFSKVDNAYCRVMDQTQTEVCRFTLSEQGNHTGIFIAMLSRQGSEWHFSAKGAPVQGTHVNEMISTIKASL